MRHAVLFTLLLCVLGSAYAAEAQAEDFYFVFFLDVFDIPSPFALLNLFLDQPQPISNGEEILVDPFEQPDFSGITDASQCENVPEFWKVDCLNAVIVNLQNRLDNLEYSLVNLANDSAYMFRLQFVGTYAFMISVLVFLAIFLCCCTTKKEKNIFSGKQYAADVPYVVLRPMDTVV